MSSRILRLRTFSQITLANGNIVELGDFGHFWLRFSAEGVEDATDVRGEQITTLIPRFIPGKQFKRTLGSTLRLLPTASS